MSKEVGEQLNAFDTGDSLPTMMVAFLKLDKNLRLFNSILDKTIRDIRG